MSKKAMTKPTGRSSSTIRRGQAVPWMDVGLGEGLHDGGDRELLVGADPYAQGGIDVEPGDLFEAGPGPWSVVIGVMRAR
jgi:hypothetical protein